MKRSKEEQIVWDIYCSLYRNSTPPADFNELAANAEVNSRGEKEIDFMSHEISYELFEELMDIEINKHKLHKYRQAAIRSTVYLGCSPKYKFDE